MTFHKGLHELKPTEDVICKVSTELDFVRAFCFRRQIYSDKRRLKFREKEFAQVFFKILDQLFIWIKLLVNLEFIHEGVF